MLLARRSRGGKKRLAKEFEEIKLMETLDPLAHILQARPGHLPALVCLGLIAFAGHAPTYKAVMELNVIPVTSARAEDHIRLAGMSPRRLDDQSLIRRRRAD